MRAGKYNKKFFKNWIYTKSLDGDKSFDVMMGKNSELIARLYVECGFWPELSELLRERWYVNSEIRKIKKELKDEYMYYIENRPDVWDGRDGWGF